jgi:hypothetical protein
VVAGRSPVSGAETAAALLPAPASPVLVRVPYAVVVPNLKKNAVGTPFGSTLPAIVAVCGVTALALLVLTVGAVAATALVAVQARTAIGTKTTDRKRLMFLLLEVA